ncbi:MAG: nitroreductase family protein [Nitriliruptorales bacterium]|nr:nitroreductase family protein [Nitriliruptorales bacterium]
MELQDAIAQRRMVRNYTDDPVDRAVIERLVDSARRAPSAGFSQGQRFVVVTDADRRREIAELGGESYYVEQGFDPWMSRAPVHIVPCADEGAYRRRYAEEDKGSTPPDEQEWPAPYWHVDIGAALMALLLRVVEEGLAAGFFGIHRLQGLKDLLGIPDDAHPIGVVTVGHPAPDRKSGSLERGWRPLEEVLRWEGW